MPEAEPETTIRASSGLTASTAMAGVLTAGTAAATTLWEGSTGWPPLSRMPTTLASLANSTAPAPGAQAPLSAGCTQ